jgi:hypothetical protein
MLIIPTTHKMPAPNYNPQHNFKVCKFKIWLSPASIPRASLSKWPMIPHLQKCRCQSAHTNIRQTDPDHHTQTKYHIYNKHSKYKQLHTCNNMFNQKKDEVEISNIVKQRKMYRNYSSAIDILGSFGYSIITEIFVHYISINLLHIMKAACS